MHRPPLVVAHRGASADAIDNSHDAFVRAIEDGADMIEFDVRGTADGRLIAFHDEAVGGRRLAELTYEEIAELTGHRPPLVEEVVALAARRRIGLDIEFKEDHGVAEVLGAVDDVAPLLVTSFLPEVVREARALRPDVAAGLLLEGAGASEIVAGARAVGATAVALDEAAARAGLQEAARAGLEVYVWTVDEPAALREWLAHPDASGVITNVPARALAIRDELTDAA